MPKYYTPLQTAALLGLSKNTMYKHIKDGTIRSVRLGEGRIRIPASELKNLIDITEDIAQENVSSEVPSLPLPMAIDNSPSEIAEEEIDIEELKPPTGIDIYDWFVGIGSSMVSLAMFLFHYGGINLDKPPVESILWFLRILLFVWGWGHILIALLLPQFALRKRLSYLFGGLVYSALVATLIYNNTVAGISLYISMSLGLIVSAGLLIDPMKKYLIHLAIGATSMIALYFVFPANMFSIWAQLPGSFDQAKILAGIFAAIFVLAVCLVILFRRSGRSLKVVGNLMLVGIGIYAAYYCVLFGFWDRVLLLIVWIVFGALYPFHEQINWGGGDKRWVIAECIGVIGIMVVVVTIMAGLMSNLRLANIDNSADSLTHTIKESVDREMEKAQSSLKAVAGSRILRNALVGDDQETQREYLRDMVRGSSDYLQMYLYDNQGSVTAYYPDTSLTIVGEYAEYYRSARKGESFVTSSLDQSQVDGAPWQVVVAVPVVDDSGAIVGVLAGRLNIEVLNNIVASEAKTGQGLAYLLDQNGRVIAAGNGSDSEIVEEIGSFPQKPQLSPKLVENAEIAQVDESATVPAQTGVLTGVKTDCCNWQVVFEKNKVGVIDTFEFVGLILVLGVMILIAVGVAVLGRIERKAAQTAMIREVT